MVLEHIRVCVDGFNLELPQGTGVKSYGVTLVNALRQLGASVDVLCSRPIASDHPLLAETLFFDQIPEQAKSPSRKDLIKSLILNLSGLGLKAKRIYLTPFVIRSVNDYFFEDLAESGGEIFNRSKCFVVANQIRSKLNLESHVRVPKKLDVWHATFPLPIQVNSAKRITTIHDLIPLRLPYTTLDNKKFFFNLVQDSIKKSQLVLTVSENTKHDIIHNFRVNPDKIFVTHQPIPNSELDIDPDFLEATLEHYQLLAKQYFLFVGAIEPKKNLGRLIRAYSRLDTDFPLVVVGKRGWLWKQEIGDLKALFGDKFQQRVKFLNYVSRHELIHLYHGATALVFPSLYEGFGLPPLEAMFRGCPVITSKASSLPEICGDAALYVDPYSVDDLYTAMAQLISDGELQDRLSHLGTNQAQHFSVETYLHKLEAAYQKVLS